MLFSSMLFLWVFLPIVLGLYMIVEKKYKNALLLLASLIFYGWGEPKYILLMFICITVNYYFGIYIEESSTDKKAKMFLMLCIIVNLAVLGYFKYFNFIIENINLIFKGNINTHNVILPIGISFYTFQALSYVVDVYRNKGKENGIRAQRSFMNLALYVSFFPQLIAGPIVKYHDIEVQLNHRITNVQTTAYGIKRFSYGLGKKVLISNTMAMVADKIFEVDINQIGTSIAWIGIICYTLQIYFDFSGYSDMAIGLGKIFGFDFMENFNYPYISQSIQEFWRRWHISLSTWFKEYLYIPLGGNRAGDYRTYINLMIVFFATGIWHGASWNFIIWGLFHGAFLVIERLWLGRWLKNNRFKIINHVYVVLVVMIGWVFFRVETTKEAINYLYRLFIFTPNNSIYTIEYFLNIEVILVLVVGILLSGVVQQKFSKFRDILYDKNVTYTYEFIIIPMIIIICILSLASGAYNPFIYFRF